MTTAGAILARAERALSASGLPPGDAALLIAHAIGKSKEFIFTHPHRGVSALESKLFDRLLARRMNGHSVAALVGYKYFFGLRFLVSERTLIPRPESEALVEYALAHLRNEKSAAVIDVGTGCGNLIISLAVTQPQARGHRYYAVDNAGDALAVASRNAANHQQNITFIASDLFATVPRLQFDLIMANLPYLSNDRMQEPSIRKEPVGALWGGPDGMAIYRRFFEQAKPFTAPKARVIIEMNPEQENELTRLARKNLSGVVTCERDLEGLPRFLIIQH